MRTKKLKPAPLPVIDLGGCVKVIDDGGEKPVWKVLERVPAASVENAKRVLRKHRLSGGWLFDNLGNKEFVTV